jgi:HK97 gp10 family phage protein
VTFTFSLDVTEVQDYAAQLAAHAGEGAHTFVPTAVKYRDLVIKEAKRIVPVDTGDLRDSIRPEQSEASTLQLSANITVGMPYAGFVEFGTANMGPQPYIRPSLRKYRRPYTDELVQVAKDTLGVTKGGSRRVLRGVRRFGR